MPLFAVDFDFSVAWQPISFFHRVYGTEPTSLFGDEFFEKGQYFTYQSSLRFRSGLNLGFGFGWDSGYDVNNNVVGLVSDVLAFIGYDRFSIRVSHGNSHSIGKTTVDLLMDTYGIDPFTPAPWYMFAGINYTYLESPLPLTSIGGEGYNINAVTHLYGIILGSDLFSYFINKPKNGIEFSFWWDGFISLGIGTTTYQENTEFAWDFRVSYTGGILIAGGSRINWCLGLGYNVDGGFTNLLHHGFVVRFGIKI
jgi:hypothetical protein